jgi:kynurenine formamidase
LIVWVENGGIVGRGVLLDYAAWTEKQGIKVNHLSRYGIPIAHLRQLIIEEKIVTRPGDIVFIRSGFTRAYEALSPAEEAALPPSKGRHVIGIEPTLDTARWIWENQFAAIAGDMPGFEKAPEIAGDDEPLHQWLLAGWGCPIGEMFYLEELSRECARLGRNTFFLSSMPLKVNIRFLPNSRDICSANTGSRRCCKSRKRSCYSLS